MIYLFVFLGLLGVCTGYLIVVVFFPGFDFPAKTMILHGKSAAPADSLPFREEVEFLVDGQRIRGWFYRSSVRPGSSNSADLSGSAEIAQSSVASLGTPGSEHDDMTAPCIIMATGLGGTRRMGLEHYALCYRKYGFHCLTFDYRNSGESEGEPRNLVWPRMQLDDLRGAMEWAAARSEIQGVFLWGASAAGAYGLILAAEQGQVLPSASSASDTEDSGGLPVKSRTASEGSPSQRDWPPIYGVVCQVPALNLKAEFKGMIRRIGLARFLRMFMHAQRDRGRGRLGLSPHYVPMVSSSGPALLQGPGVEEGYAELCPGEFSNRICARSLVMPPPPSALDGIQDVRCPVLIQLASSDNLIASDGHIEIAAALGSRAEVKRYEGGHFDLYRSPLADQVLADQVSFFSSCIEGIAGSNRSP